MTPYYYHAGITIYHGDCRDVLPSLGKFGLLLTDPPYGIGAAHYAHFGEGVKRHMSGILKGPLSRKRATVTAIGTISPPTLKRSRRQWPWPSIKSSGAETTSI